MNETRNEHGAQRIVEIADHVIANTGSLAALKLTVHRPVSTADLHRVALDVSDAMTAPLSLRTYSKRAIASQSQQQDDAL